MSADDECSLTYHASCILDETTAQFLHGHYEERYYKPDELIRTPNGIMTATKMFKNPIYHGLKGRQLIYGDYPINAMLSMLGGAKYIHGINPAIYRKHTGGAWSSLDDLEKQIKTVRSSTRILLYTLNCNHIQFSEIRAQILVTRLLEVMPKAVVSGVIVAARQKIRRAVRKLLNLPMRTVRSVNQSKIIHKLRKTIKGFVG